jgi:hypothetical protein
MRRWRFAWLLLIPLASGCSLVIGGDDCDEGWRVFEVGERSKPRPTVAADGLSVG